MSKFLDVTLIIPTHNRVHYLESVLEYYINEKKMDAQIIICDSSSIKYDGSFLDKGNVVYNYWPTLTFPEKLVTALKSVSSKYVLVSPDDDYYALDNLEDLKEVLDTNQDVTSVDGKTVLFNNEMQVTPTGMYKKSLDEESVIERLTYGYANYFPTVYSLYRTEFICNIYEKMIKYKIESHGFFEYTFFALSLIDGKHICMDNFHFARDISSTSPTPEFRGNKDEFGYHYNTNSNDYNQFIKIVAEHLSMKTDYNTEEAKDIVEQIVIDNLLNGFLKNRHLFFDVRASNTFEKFLKKFICILTTKDFCNKLNKWHWEQRMDVAINKTKGTLGYPFFDENAKKQWLTIEKILRKNIWTKSL
jgi:glycosyltransferase domain-containing protein